MVNWNISKFSTIYSYACKSKLSYKIIHTGIILLREIYHWTSTKEKKGIQFKFLKKLAETPDGALSNAVAY